MCYGFALNELFKLQLDKEMEMALKLAQAALSVLQAA